MDRFPDFQHASAVEAVLEPGDVLYLPPLWFHHVSALTTSVSASIWSKYAETQLMYETVRSPLPLKASWPKPKIILAAKLYLRKVIEEMYPVIRLFF